MFVAKIFNSIPSPEINSFDLGPVTVHFYAVLILIGIVLATFLTAKRLGVRGVKQGLVIDIVIWAVPFGIIGGRIFHVLTHIHDYFGGGADWVGIFRIWEGGLAIYGALIFGVLGAYLGCRQVGIRFFTFADALVPGLLVAQAIGRFGNYFNKELFGTPTDLPWGLEIPAGNPSYPAGLPAGELFHPAFLYESLWSILGVAVLLFIERKINPQWGELFAGYLIWYSVGRFMIEQIRLDPANVYFGQRANAWMAVFGVLVGLGILIRQRRAHHGLLTSPYLPGRQPAVETAAEPATEVSAVEVEPSETNALDDHAVLHEGVALESDKPETN
jgi:prolipoprotein diacylglyceryl transferase